MVILRPRILRFALFACGLTATAAAAQPVTVTDAWVRAPAPGQTVAAAYMELVSRQNMVLVGIASPVAAVVELHRTTVEQGVMKMRATSRIELPAGKAVRLAPGGLHAMLVDLKQPLRPGDKVLLTLTVQRADSANRGVLTVPAEVRSMDAAQSPHYH
jgi:copper(I)-binding protein